MKKKFIIEIYIFCDKIAVVSVVYRRWRIRLGEFLCSTMVAVDIKYLPQSVLEIMMQERRQKGIADVRRTGRG